MRKKVAEFLLEIGAVSLQPNDPFTWTSGIKSPIYCDNRLILSYPNIRKEIANGLANMVKSYYPDAEMIAGTATAGIPHAAWISDELELPMCYVRSKAKEHGKGKQIEGKVSEGQKVVIVEDLISTGKSVIVAAEALRKAGCEVLGAVSIFTYGLKTGQKQLDAANIQYHSLSNYVSLIEVAVKKGIIRESDMKKLQMWHEDPENRDWLQL